MEYLKIDMDNIARGEIGVIIERFSHGKIIVYPTDTIYGLGCLATDKRAVLRVFKIKRRPPTMPLIVLVGSFAMAKKYARIGRRQEEYLKSVWPGPVTAVLESGGILPDIVSGGRTTLAVRLPKNGFLGKIMRRAGVPLVSTSLNLSGRPILDNVDGLDGYFGKDKPDLAIDAGRLPRTRPSKIVDLRDVDNIKIIRN